MIRDPYADREVYRTLQNAGDLRYFRVTEGETDLMIGASRVFDAKARETVKQARSLVQSAIAERPEFRTSLAPLEPAGNEPALIRGMYDAAKIAGTGPMAAVAGAIAQEVGRGLLKNSPNVTVENGGDVFLAGSHVRTIAIAAGKSPISGRLGIRLTPGKGVGVCTSSGTYGHSLSFGKADAAVVAAEDAALADAAATMLGNKVKTPEDLAEAVEWAAALPGVLGAVAVIGDKIAAAGDIELVPIV